MYGQIGFKEVVFEPAIWLSGNVDRKYSIVCLLLLIKYPEIAVFGGNLRLELQ